jgi:hypothetical protein
MDAVVLTVHFQMLGTYRTRGQELKRACTGSFGWQY